MDSGQGNLVINPSSHEWYTLDKIERTPSNPLTFYEDWDSVKLDERASRSSQKALWPASSKNAKDKDTKAASVGLNCASMALFAVVSLLAIASLALSVLMLLGMLKPIHGSCACSKQCKYVLLVTRYLFLRIRSASLVIGRSTGVWRVNYIPFLIFLALCAAKLQPEYE